MAGTTTKYAIPYPSSTDYLADGATKIQELADRVDLVMSTTYLDVADKISTTTGYSRATGSTTFGAFTGAPTQNITTGPSAKVMIILTADIANSTSTANGMALSYSLSGSAFTPTFAKAITTQNARTGASFVYVHSLTGNSSYTLTLQGASLSGTAQNITVHNHTIQTIELG